MLGTLAVQEFAAWAASLPQRGCGAAMAQLWHSYGTAKTLSWLRRRILFYTPPLKKKPKVKITISTAAKPLITILPILVLTMALWSFLIFS